MSWPDSLKKTDIRVNWFNRISKLPPGLDLVEASRLLREPYGAVRRWAVLFGYEFPDRRRIVSPEQWAAVDWTRRDADIARSLGVTRECVRLVRRSTGVGPSAAQTAIRNFDRFVASHRDRLHGLLVEEVIHHSGTDLPYHVVRRVLREHDVRPHESHSPLREIDWRLPNRDLARFWSTSARYVANLRARLGVGPSKWNARSRQIGQSQEYTDAAARERQRAQLHRRRKGRSAHAAHRQSPAVPV